MACAGRIVLEAAFPDRGNEHSDAGTAMHEIASKVLTAVAGVDADDYVGHNVLVSDEGEEKRFVEITHEMATLVQNYVDEVRELAKGGELHVEERVEFSEFVGVPDQFGTADVIILQPAVAPQIEGDPQACHRMIVGDLKTGYHFVPVEENSQLMLYALGAYRMFELAYDIREIQLYIFQPNSGGTRTWSCTIGDLLAFAAKAHAAAQRVEEATNAAHDAGMPEAEWNDRYLHPDPNEIDCAYCRAMSTCPAKQRKLEEVVGGSFDVVIEKPANLPVNMRADLPMTRVDMMTVEVDKLARAMNAAGEFEDWIKAVRAEVERRLLLGQDVPGWGLELGREGARAWTDPEAAETLLRKTFRIPIEKAYDLKLISPTTAEKLAGFAKGKRNPKIKDVALGEKQWKRLQELVKRSPATPSVKPISVIKTPYLPLQPNADAFDNEEEDLT
jgi:hypothetical protein